jgi:hypothetical protein
MGRLLAFVLGGFALALYAPYLFMSEEGLVKYKDWWIGTIGENWHQKLFQYGPGVFAGLALLLFAVRGRDSHIVTH